MEPLTTLRAPACALPLSNVDTDQLIPARFMKEPRSAGYGRFLLHDLRCRSDGHPDPAFPLNRPGAEHARILVTGRNFGAGSSREAAVYALVDHGFRCVIAPSFGDIFASNAVNNGLLPATVTEADGQLLLDLLDERIEILEVDLQATRIRTQAFELDFTIDPVWRSKLLSGRDDIDLTLDLTDTIRTFALAHERRYPWTRPAHPQGRSTTTHPEGER